MTERILTQQHLIDFRDYLLREEKSAVTVEKYLRDARTFLTYAEVQPVTKELTVAYKKYLEERKLAICSINSMLASLNSLLTFLDWTDCKVKTIKCQRRIYCAEERELSKTEYLRLLNASKDQEQINMILQTICGTGIRISELKFFTVEAVKTGQVSVKCKSKLRMILIPGKLKKNVVGFCKKERYCKWSYLCNA